MFSRSDSDSSYCEGPTADLLPPQRIYSYSSSEAEGEDKVEDRSTRIQRVLQARQQRKPRFVSRILRERGARSPSGGRGKEMLQTEEFAPMMTSETVAEERKQEKRSVEEQEWIEPGTKFLRKGTRRQSDYGSMSSLGSDITGEVDSMQGDDHDLEVESDELGEVEITGDMQVDPAAFISECITFRSTLAQLKKQSLHLVKVIYSNNFLRIV